MISAVFRRGGDVSFVVEELKGDLRSARRAMGWGGRYVPSLLAAIGEVIERHMIEIGFLGGGRGPAFAAEGPAPHVPSEGARARFCPRCGDPSFVKLEGCDSCLSLSAIRSVAEVPPPTMGGPPGSRIGATGG